MKLFTKIAIIIAIIVTATDEAIIIFLRFAFRIFTGSKISAFTVIVSVPALLVISKVSENMPSVFGAKVIFKLSFVLFN